MFVYPAFRTSSRKVVFNLLSPYRSQTAKIVSESTQHQEKMLLEVTSELRGAPLVPQTCSGGKTHPFGCCRPPFLDSL